MPTDEITKIIEGQGSEFLKRRISFLEASRKDVLKKISNLMSAPLLIGKDRKDSTYKILLEKYLNDLDTIDELLSRFSESLSESLEKEKNKSSSQKKDVREAYGEFVPYYSNNNDDTNKTWKFGLKVRG